MKAFPRVRKQPHGCECRCSVKGAVWPKGMNFRRDILILILVVACLCNRDTADLPEACRTACKPSEQIIAFTGFRTLGKGNQPGMMSPHACESLSQLAWSQSTTP